MLGLLIGLLLTANVNPQALTVNLSVATDTPKVWTIPELQAIATSSAQKYHLTKRQTNRMLATINCESQWVATSTGDYGTSIGIAQIHLPAHQDITKEQALDPVFSLDWTAQQFAVGNQRIWSCWNTLYGG